MIGFLVWWDLLNIDVSPNKLHALFSEAHLKNFNETVRYRRIFSTVINTIQKQQYSKAASIRVVSKDLKKEQIFVIVDEHLDKDRVHLACKQSCSFRFDCKTGALTADWPHPIFDQIKKLYKEGCKKATPRELFLALVEIIEQKTDGFKLRATGGFYFVPHTGLEVVSSLRRIFKELADGCIYCIPVTTSPDLKAAVAREFARHIVESLADIRLRVRIKSFGSRLGLFKTQRLREKVDFYCNLLDVSLDPVYRLVDEQARVFKEKAIEEVKTKPQRKRKP